MRTNARRRIPVVEAGLMLLALWGVSCTTQSPARLTKPAVRAVAGETDALAIVKPGVQTGFSNGGWNLDRYRELKPLADRSEYVARAHRHVLEREIHASQPSHAK